MECMHDGAYKAGERGSLCCATFILTDGSLSRLWRPTIFFLSPLSVSLSRFSLCAFLFLRRQRPYGLSSLVVRRSTIATLKGRPTDKKKRSFAPVEKHARIKYLYQSPHPPHPPHPPPSCISYIFYISSQSLLPRLWSLDIFERASTKAIVHC